VSTWGSTQESKTGQAPESFKAEIYFDR
jgi:hypothetical protein